MKNARLITTAGRKIVSAALVLFVMLSLVFVTDLRARAEGADEPNIIIEVVPAEKIVNLSENAFDYNLDGTARTSLMEQTQRYYYNPDDHNNFITIKTKTFYADGHTRYYSADKVWFDYDTNSFPHYSLADISKFSYKISSDQRELTITFTNVNNHLSSTVCNSATFTVTFYASGGDLYYV